MTNHGLELLLNRLSQTPVKQSELLLAARDQGSRWTADQLRLCLRCLGLQFEPDGGEDPVVRLAARSDREILAQAILDVVRANPGQPLPAARVRELLPDRLTETTSVEQIRAVAREVTELTVFGPGLIRLKG